MPQELPTIFGASVIGPLHIQNGIPCQDACAFAALSSGYGVIAVADGLGSASKSEMGAHLAVDTAVATAKEFLANQKFETARPGDLVRETVIAARKALESKAGEAQWELRDLACTIIVVIILDDMMAVAHIGDGAVVAKTADGLKLISGPEQSEYANEVVPLTSKEWEKSLRIVPQVSGARGAIVFTDGCQRAALLKSQNDLKPYEGFFAPLFAYAEELNDLKEGEEEIKTLLSSKKICANSEDDKTLVMAILKGKSARA